MQTIEEILNIEFHTKRLIIRALNECKNKRAAAKALGMTERNLHRLIARYRVVRETSFGGRYFMVERVGRLKIA